MSGLGDSQSGSSASMNTCSLEAELSSEFMPKVPRRLRSLVVVVSIFIQKGQDQSFWMRQAEQRVDVGS